MKDSNSLKDTYKGKMFIFTYTYNFTEGMLHHINHIIDTKYGVFWTPQPPADLSVWAIVVNCVYHFNQFFKGWISGKQIIKVGTLGEYSHDYNEI